MDFYDACKNGNLEKVKRFVAEGADPNRKNPVTNQYPFYLAVTNGRLDVIKFMLEKGVDANKTTNDYGWTPLYTAALNRKSDVVKLLIENGVDMYVENSSGLTVMDAACFNGEIEMMKLLLKHGYDLKRSNRYGKTPLHNSCDSNGGKRTVKLLIDSGANVNSKDSDGRTPLYFAVVRGVFSVVKLLVENGADINIKVNGNTAFQTTIRKFRNFFPDYPKIAEYLIKSGANVNEEDDEGFTPLIFSTAKEPIFEAVKLLLENGADANKETHDGFTPLITAVGSHETKLVEYLIEHGADVNQITKAGSCFENSRDEMAILLIKNGVRLDRLQHKEDFYGTTFEYKKLLEDTIRNIRSGWTKENHKYFPFVQQRKVRCLVGLHSVSWISKIPKCLLFSICRKMSLL
jgi:ankyrin repeat protein